jgi:glutathione synthase
MWLRLHGWRILAERARVPGGEVDLIARRGRTLAFVEVKARASDDAAARSLDAHRLRRVAVAAERLAARYMRPDDELRIDALFIVPRRLPRHMPNCLARVTKARPGPSGGSMTLTVAVQMDPLEGIGIAGDSTFALMLSAQARGYRLYHYLAEALTYRDGRLYAGAYPVTVQPVPGDHFKLGDLRVLDLSTDVDVVLMRQDPPFDLGYITATHLLERIKGETLVVNDPASVRNAPEKLWVLDFAQFMPPTVLTRSLDVAREFLAKHGAAVLKPLHGNAGKAVFKIGSEGENLGALLEVFNTTYREPHVLQAFLPEVSQGDKRIVLVDGEVAGAINRIPGEGEIRSNLAAGGTAQATQLTGEELEICAALGPELKRRGLLFVGIDVIGGKWLTEINVTSPTGIVAIDKFTGADTAALIWNAIERKLAERRTIAA